MLWLAADRGITQEAGAVVKWADQSGNHADAVQTDSTLRPTLDRRAFGGMGAMLFDGQDDFLKLPAGFADFTHGQSFFAMVDIAQDAGCTAVVEVSNGSEIDDIDFGRYNGATLFEVFDQDHSGIAMPTGTPELYTVIQYSDSTVQMRINGAGSGDINIALPANITRQDNYVGNTLYVGCTTFSGHIGEILWYDRAVSDSELLDIEGYLGQRAHCCQ